MNTNPSKISSYKRNLLFQLRKIKADIEITPETLYNKLKHLYLINKVIIIKENKMIVEGFIEMEYKNDCDHCIKNNFNTFDYYGN